MRITKITTKNSTGRAYTVVHVNNIIAIVRGVKNRLTQWNKTVAICKGNKGTIYIVLLLKRA